MFAHVKPLCSTFSAEGSEVNSFSTREKRGKTCVTSVWYAIKATCMHVLKTGRGERGGGLKAGDTCSTRTVGRSRGYKSCLFFASAQ